MNVWFCSADKPFKFIGRINEDTNTYCLLGSQGELMMTVANADIVQVQTQKQSGGLTDVYLNDGTYVKSFFTVMATPSCAKVGQMGGTHFRAHHKIEWNYCVPKIINEKWKK